MKVRTLLCKEQFRASALSLTLMLSVLVGVMAAQEGMLLVPIFLAVGIHIVLMELGGRELIQESFSNESLTKFVVLCFASAVLILVGVIFQVLVMDRMAGPPTGAAVADRIQRLGGPENW